VWVPFHSHQSASGWRHLRTLARFFRWDTIRPPIADLQTACTLALDDDLAVPRAKFDLANMAPGATNLLGNKSRAGKAVAGLASRNVVAMMDADGRWFGIEIRLKHPGVGDLPVDVVFTAG